MNKTIYNILNETKYETFIHWNAKFLLQKFLFPLHLGSCQNYIYVFMYLYMYIIYILYILYVLHTYMHIYTYKYIYTYTYIYTYIYTQWCIQRCFGKIMTYIVHTFIHLINKGTTMVGAGQFFKIFASRSLESSPQPYLFFDIFLNYVSFNY